MTQDTFAHWIVVALIVLGVAVPLWWQVVRRSRPKFRPTDPEISSEFYRAYQHETLRLAGFPNAQIAAYLDQTRMMSTLQALCEAEEILLTRIIEVHFLGIGDRRDLGEFNRKYRQGRVDELRKTADGERNLSFAIELLKKLNPLISKIAGNWIGNAKS